MTTRPSLTSHSEAFHTVVAGAVAAIVVVLHLLCLPSQAITDDDDFYAPAGIRAADDRQGASSPCESRDDAQALQQDRLV